MHMMLFSYIYSSVIDSILPLIIFLIIVFGSCLLIIRIAREAWEFRRNYVRSNHLNCDYSHIPKMKMIQVHIPFTFKLQETASADNEINCMVSSQDSYKFMVFWGVSIREMHLILWEPWTILRRAIKDGSFLHGCCQQTGTHIENSSHEEKRITLHLPSESFDLGAPPRSRYPLVIFLITDCIETAKPEDAVALVNIIHLKDPVCTLPTSILDQYLKQASGQLSCLKQLYLASDHPENENFDEIDLSHQLCVVCQYFPLSRALLPCRHTCVCASCFNKLKSCPLCRSPIRSYFCIKSEEYLPEYDKNVSQNRTLYEKVQDLIGELLEGEEWVP